MSKKLLIELLSNLLIICFAATTAGKITNYEVFVGLIRFQPYINLLLPNFVWIIPIGELLISIALIIPASRLIALHTVAFTMLLAAVYRIYLMALDIHLPCTCGDLFRTFLSEPIHIVYNLSLAAIAIITVKAIKKQRNSKPSTMVTSAY